MIQLQFELKIALFFKKYFKYTALSKKFNYKQFSMAWETRVQSQVESYQRLKNGTWYLPA